MAKKDYSKEKKNARLISRMVRNKPKPPVKSEPIVVSEDSDSSIERFLAKRASVTNLLMILLKIYLPVCGITLTSLALNHLMKPLVNRRNPRLLNLLQHLAISVGYG